MCGSNLIGVMAPIVTGYIVGSSKSFDAAFVLTGVILLVGVVILLGLTRGGIGEAAEEEVGVVTGLRASQARSVVSV
ncbi:MAG TPA: hypothetical protein VEP50_05200 [bacterium]|nr:hypothetical protein [bacterium]